MEDEHKAEWGGQEMTLQATLLQLSDSEKVSI